jgi:hypothetical protein
MDFKKTVQAEHPLENIKEGKKEKKARSQLLSERIFPTATKFEKIPRLSQLAPQTTRSHRLLILSSKQRPPQISAPISSCTLDIWSLFIRIIWTRLHFESRVEICVPLRVLPCIKNEKR